MNNSNDTDWKEKYEQLQEKYKKLAAKHRYYLQQKYPEKIQRVKTYSNLRCIILELCKKIVEISSDDELPNNMEQITKLINSIRL